MPWYPCHSHVTYVSSLYKRVNVNIKYRSFRRNFSYARIAKLALYLISRPFRKKDNVRHRAYNVTTPILPTDSSTFLLHIFISFQVSRTRRKVNLQSDRLKAIREDQTGFLASERCSRPCGTAMRSREADEHRNACYQFPYAIAYPFYGRTRDAHTTFTMAKETFQ